MTNEKLTTVAFSIAIAAIMLTNVVYAQMANQTLNTTNSTTFIVPINTTTSNSSVSQTNATYNTSIVTTTVPAITATENFTSNYTGNFSSDNTAIAALNDTVTNAAPPPPVPVPT